MPGWPDRSRDRLRGMLRARLGDWTAADDLAQDAFVTAFRKLRDFRGDSSFESWLRAIAMNHLRNFIRKRREMCVGGDAELQELLGAGDGAACREGERLAALRECLKRIQGPSRELLDSRYVTGKSVRQISAETGRGYSALTMQLHRLRVGFRGHPALDENEQDAGLTRGRRRTGARAMIFRERARWKATYFLSEARY